MKLIHAMWGHPRRSGPGAEIWQNVVHWRREWQTTSLFLPWEPHGQYEKQNDRILKEELPRSVGAQYATGDQWRNNSRKNEGMERKQKQYSVVNGTGNKSKVWCCKEQYCIGTWNVRSTNQGKLEVVKQETARVSIDILGISKLKWTGMGEFNSDDHYIYYCGQESLRRNGIAIMANKSPKCSTWVQSQKWQNWEGDRQEGQRSPNGGNKLQVSNIFISLKRQEETN